MKVFALEREAIPLRTLRDALEAAGYPVSISTGIAGDASDAELDATDWEAAFVRWKEPEVHEVYIVERDIVGIDEEAERDIAEAIRFAHNHPESGGKLIVADHLRRTQAVYDVQMLPALLDDEDHPAWAALDVALRSLATAAEGIIYAEDEGFYDADGEALLLEGDERPDENSKAEE